MNKIIYYAREIDRIRNGDFVFPVTCEIDPSNRCLLDCSFCMYRSHLQDNQQDLPIDVFKTLAGELKGGGCKSITFTGGGEPLMNLNFNEMADYALSLGFEVGLITNGVLLNTVKSPEKFKFIRVSLDASDEESYRSVKGKSYFKKVVNNIYRALNKGGFVGISYVVCHENKSGIDRARRLSEEIGAKYIQFKPAWVDGKSIGFVMPCVGNTIVTNRYVAEDNLPCQIAELIGIVGADAHLYYCCQYRGDKRYDLGSLEEDSFSNLWRKRANISPEIKECPQCRYMNYAKAYKEINGGIFFEHKNFL